MRNLVAALFSQVAIVAGTVVIFAQDRPHEPATVAAPAVIEGSSNIRIGSGLLASRGDKTVINAACTDDLNIHHASR
jgi:hypothetical protein